LLHLSNVIWYFFATFEGSDQTTILVYEATS
jgi:hypothetical protein